MNKQTVLITGASSGIGLELARKFAREGYSLVLVARSIKNLEQLADELRKNYKVEAHVLAADLRLAGAASGIAQELKSRNLAVDILVNNAGFGLLGPFAQLDAQQQLDMIQVNIVALSALTRLLLPPMIERNVGGILNVASMAAFQAGPNLAVYYATKAFVLSFTEALHEEVSHTNLHVSCLCPGPTHTGFVAAANMENVNLFKLGAQSAAEVAEYGFKAYQQNRAIAIPGLKNWLLGFSTKFSPRLLTRKVAGLLNR